jgi:hypothetical protein
LNSKHAKAGDVVELRSPGEILSTLDEDGRLDGLPFMPEMLAYFGGRHRVTARVQRACDTIGPEIGVRRIPNAVILDDLRCDGFAHGGCQAACRLYWKEEWLRPAGEVAPTLDRSDTDFEELARRVSGVIAGVEDGVPVYRCQATALPKASVAVTRPEAPRSFVAELQSSNVAPGKFAAVVARTVGESLAKRVRLMSRGLFMPYDADKHERTGPAQELRPGQLVRIRSKDEIARTLGPDGKHKGLWFDREMAQYCGRTARVLQKVDRIVDERTGRMIELKNDCYILDGIVCTGDRSKGRRFCTRAIYPYWRACWLDPLAEVQALAPLPSASPSEGAPSPPPPVAA